MWYINWGKTQGKIVGKIGEENRGKWGGGVCGQINWLSISQE